MNGRLLAAVALGLTLGAASTSRASDLKTIAENIAAHKDLTILLTAAKETRLLDGWNAKGPFTLFAPTDAAFKKLGETQIQKIVADKELLKKLLLSHIVFGKVLTAAELKNYDGKELNGFRVSSRDGLKLGEAKVTIADIKCSNGVIHAIDMVLMP